MRRFSINKCRMTVAGRFISLKGEIIFNRISSGAWPVVNLMNWTCPWQCPDQILPFTPPICSTTHDQWLDVGPASSADPMLSWRLIFSQPSVSVSWPWPERDCIFAQCARFQLARGVLTCDWPRIFRQIDNLLPACANRKSPITRTAPELSLGRNHGMS